jgi:hypothetical protein
MAQGEMECLIKTLLWDEMSSSSLLSMLSWHVLVAPKCTPLPSTMGAESLVVEACEELHRCLGVDRIDLYQIHSGETGDQKKVCKI